MHARRVNADEARFGEFLAQRRDHGGQPLKRGIQPGRELAGAREGAERVHVEVEGEVSHVFLLLRPEGEQGGGGHAGGIQMAERHAGIIGAHPGESGFKVFQRGDLNAVLAGAVERDLHRGNAALQVAQDLGIGFCCRRVGEQLADVPGAPLVRRCRRPAQIGGLAGNA